MLIIFANLLLSILTVFLTIANTRFRRPHQSYSHGVQTYRGKATSDLHPLPASATLLASQTDEQMNQKSDNVKQTLELFIKEHEITNNEPRKPNHASRSVEAISPRSSLHDLPIELKFELLEQLPDLHTLSALSQVSKAFYGAYQNDKNNILSKILPRSMGQNVYADAVAVLHASRLNYTFEDHQEIVESFLVAYSKPEYAETCPKSLNPNDVQALADFHKTVYYFVDDFCRTTLRGNPATGNDLDHIKPPSESERNRITRAFYIFELFCRLFRRPKHHMKGVKVRVLMGTEEKTTMFLSLFPAYRVEELTCVRDYMVRRLKDIRLGVEIDKDMEPPWDDRISEGYYENRMAQGLQHIYQLFNAAESTTRSNLFNQDLDFHKNHNCFLTDTLRDFPYCLINIQAYYESHYHEDPETFEGDDEEGPNAAWTWSNNDVVEHRYSSYEREPLRSWGYVMWDYSRLQAWGILQTDSSPYRLPRDGFSYSDHPIMQRLRYEHMNICDRVSDDSDSSEDDEEEEEEEDSHEDILTPKCELPAHAMYKISLTMWLPTYVKTYMKEVWSNFKEDHLDASVISNSEKSSAFSSDASTTVESFEKQPTSIRVPKALKAPPHYCKAVLLDLKARVKECVSQKPTDVISFPDDQDDASASSPEEDDEGSDGTIFGQTGRPVSVNVDWWNPTSDEQRDADPQASQASTLVVCKPSKLKKLKEKMKGIFRCHDNDGEKGLQMAEGILPSDTSFERPVVQKLKILADIDAKPRAKEPAEGNGTIGKGRRSRAKAGLGKALGRVGLSNGFGL